MQIERRTTSQKIAKTTIRKQEKRAEGDEPRTVGGYGAVFYNPADPGTEIELWENTFERIMPGAFDKTLADAEADVLSLFNHNDNFVLGRRSAETLRLSVDATGLIYEVDENPADPQWTSVAAKVQRGDVTGASFMFRVREQVWRDEDDRSTREILDVELIEVGPVTFPWYPSASAGMRAENVDELKRSRQAAIAELAQRSAAARRRVDADWRWTQVQHTR